jgi:hypothetical protein
MTPVFADQGKAVHRAGTANLDMMEGVVTDTNSGSWGGAPQPLVTELVTGTPLTPTTERPIGSSKIAQSDSRFVDIGTILPSGMGFYPDFDTLAVRPMGPLEGAKMHRAVIEQSVRHQVDAISATLDRSAYAITMGDFQYLMYWSRLNSFKKFPVKLEFTCTHPDHQSKVRRHIELEKKVAAGYVLTDEDKLNPGLAPQTLDQFSTVQASVLKESRLDFDACNAFMEKFFAEHGLYLWTPLVADMVEGLEDATITADDNYWNRYAGLLNPMHHGVTLKARREFLLKFMESQESIDILADFEEWATLCTHGVDEQVEVKCTYCGDDSRQPLRIDPMSFLPQLFNKK